MVLVLWIDGLIGVHYLKQCHVIPVYAVSTQLYQNSLLYHSLKI